MERLTNGILERGCQPKKNNMEATEVMKASLVGDMKSRVRDISLIVSWREIAHQYFDRSASWLYHKLDGIDGNGGSGGFTEKEAATLRAALLDVSARLRKVAETI